MSDIKNRYEGFTKKRGITMAHLEINLFSKILNRSTDITLILPSDYFQSDFQLEYSKTHYQDKANKKMPLLILLHGYLGDHHSWCQYTSVERYAEENQIAVVMISGENQYFLNNQYIRWYDFIEEELKDYLYGNFPISNKREDNFIAGLSMGGYGALFHGLSNPKAYSAIGAFSPATRAANLSKNGMIVENPSLKSLVKKNKRDLPNIYLAIGSEDFLLPQNENFIKFLEENYIVSTHEIVEGYKHEWRFWDMELNKFMKIISKLNNL